MNEDPSECSGLVLSCHSDPTSHHSPDENHGQHSPASDVDHCDGSPTNDDNESHRSLGSDPYHSDQSANSDGHRWEKKTSQGAQSRTNDKCETFSLRIKTEDEEGGETSDVVSAPWDSPQGEEVKMSSGDESQTASEETERHCEDQKARIHCCVICGKAFSTRSGLCQHKKNHHGGAKPHKCIHCGKRFAYRNPLTVHLRTHTKEKPFLCPLCGKGFSLMGHVRSHMKIHSKKTSVETNLEEGEEAVGGLINSDGEEVEWDPASLGEGLKLHLDNKEDQTASEEPGQLQENETAGKHSCKVCGKEFSTRSGLCQHKKKHTGVQPHECKHCGKRFAYRNPLEIHLRTHTKERPFPCPVCGKRFSQMGNARSHMKIHSKEASGTAGVEGGEGEEEEEGEDGGEEAVGGFINSDGEVVEWDPASVGTATDVTWPGAKQSEENGAALPVYPNSPEKEADSHSSLSKDKKVTTRDRPHQCLKCGKRFQFQLSLKRHSRTHNKKKPFTCRVCGRGYSRRCRLTAHQKTHKETSSEAKKSSDLEEDGEQAVEDGALDGEETSSPINSDGEDTEWNPEGTAPDGTGDQQLEESITLCCCQECGKEFSNPRALHRHQKTHAGEKPHKCAQCGKGFNYLNRLKRHQLIHTQEKPFSCPACSRAFSRKDRLKEHLNTHSEWSAEAKEIDGSVDGEETADSPDISDEEDVDWIPEGLSGDKHRPASAKREHSRNRTPRKRRKRAEAEELFSCADCDKELQSVYARDRHVREKHGRNLLHKCSDCGQTFRANRSLAVHRRIYHPPLGLPVEPQEERRAPKTYLCPTCGKEFPTSASLNRHLIIHSGKKPYRCQVCGRGFTQIGNLKTHQKVHKGMKPTNETVVEESGSPTSEAAQPSEEIRFCHLCLTQFSDRKLLEEHMAQVHESKKPFACKDCGKRFMYFQKLKDHQVVHEGLKPYQCTQCDRGFGTSKGLENHMRDHTGEKPFPCSICGKRFKQASTLRAHYVTHSGERPHLCSVCGKRYARAEELKVHLRVHTGEKPYQCDECGKSFYYRQGFNNHKKTHNAKPIGPTRQLGRPRQLDRPRKMSKPKRVPQRALPDSDGEDLTWDPPNLGDSPNHHLGNQENHAASDHSQISQWNFTHHYSGFNPWGQHPNTSYWRGAEGHQPYYGPAGPSMSFSALLRGPMDEEHLQDSCVAERPSWPPGFPLVPGALDLGLGPSHPHSTSSHRTPSNKRGGERNHYEEHGATAQDIPPPEEVCSGASTVEESDTPEHPQDEVDQPHEGEPEPRQLQGGRRPKKVYNCPTCGKVFSHNTALRRHLVIHTGKRPFKCDICGRGFTQSGNLKTHMKVHRGENPIVAAVQEESPTKSAEPPVTIHVCGECGMDFPQKQQLDEHRKIHNKPYPCADCGKRFKNEYYFKIHQRMHTGDSPFLCSECGKSCVTADALKKHELTHTGEKNFHCDQCGRAFIQSSHLNVHLKTHTGERPHLCSICGKSYSKACDLKVHLRVHTGEKPYTCDICGKCFYYSQGYRAHLKTHEKKPKRPTKPLGRPKQQSIMDK